MVLLLFYNGDSIEVELCEDVVHKPGCLVCLDYLGASIASYLDDDILGYTFEPATISLFQSADGARVLERHIGTKLSDDI